MGLGICKQAIRASAAAAARRWGIDQRTASTTRSPSISDLQASLEVAGRRASLACVVVAGTCLCQEAQMKPINTILAFGVLRRPFSEGPRQPRDGLATHGASSKIATATATMTIQPRIARPISLPRSVGKPNPPTAQIARPAPPHRTTCLSHPHPRIGAASDKTHLNVAHAFQTEPITDFLLGNQNAAGVMHSLFCSVTTRLTAISRQRRKFERNARPPTVGAFRSRVQVASLLPFGAQFRSAVTCLIAQNVRGSPSPPAADLTHQGGWAAQQTGSVYGAGSRPRTSPYHRRQFL